jgi:hypothetical protein
MMAQLQTSPTGQVGAGADALPQSSQHAIDSANFSGASDTQRPSLHITCDTMMSAMHRADLHATQCPAGLHSAARSALPCQPMCRPFSSPALRAQAATHPELRHIRGNRLGRCRANFLDVAWGVTGDLSAQVALRWTGVVPCLRQTDNYNILTYSVPFVTAIQ